MHGIPRFQKRTVLKTRASKKPTVQEFGHIGYISNHSNFNVFREVEIIKNILKLVRINVKSPGTPSTNDSLMHQVENISIYLHLSMLCYAQFKNARQSQMKIRLKEN